MPILDEERGVLVLRLVYDGPPHSGKTTSLRTLSKGLAADIVTPQEQDGRTLYFDWVDYVGGLFEGRRIRCQIVSVPGQHALAERRRHILESADAVVLVADSTPEPFGQALGVLRNLLPWCRSRKPPAGIVVQANKRDVPGALTRGQIRDQLDLIAPIALTETVATSGEGVREAFVLAVRLALDRVRALADRGELRRGRPDTDDPAALLAELQALGEMPFDTASRTKPTTLPDSVGAALSRLVDVAAAEAGAESPARQNERDDDTHHVRGVAEVIQVTEVTEVTEAPSDGGASASEAAPLPEEPFAPDPMMAGGFIWPPVDGRSLLHEVARLGLVPERNERGDWAASGGGWRFHSRASALFVDVNSGRVALIDWARVHAALLRVLSPGRALILAEAGAGRVRLWQLVRVEATLRESLTEAVAGSAMQVVLGLTFATQQLLRARESMISVRSRLPCTLWTVGSDAMRQPIFVGLMPELDESPDEELGLERLVERELAPILGRLRRERSDYLEIARHLRRSSEMSPDADGLRVLARLSGEGT